MQSSSGAFINYDTFSATVKHESAFFASAPDSLADLIANRTIIIDEIEGDL